MINLYNEDEFKLLINKNLNQKRFLFLFNFLCVLISIIIYILINRENVNILKIIFIIFIIIFLSFDVYFIDTKLKYTKKIIRFENNLFKSNNIIYQNANINIDNKDITIKGITCNTLNVKTRNENKSFLIEKNKIDKINNINKADVIIKDGYVFAIKEIDHENN